MPATAPSIESNEAIGACRRAARADVALAGPTQQPITGTRGAAPTASTRAAAASAPDATPVELYSASTASTLSSASAALTDAANAAGALSPPRSAGLARDQACPSAASIATSVDSPNDAMLAPTAGSLSSARIAGPPPLLTIAILLPPIARPCASTSAASNRSVSVSTTTMPARRKAARATSWAPVIAPVCDMAAAADPADRPAFIAITGLVRDAARAADMNLAGLVTPST